LQIPLNNWKATDIVATATLVQAIFATGGGNEVNSALYYESLVQRYGAAKGAQLFADFKSQNDPDARVSIPTTFTYEHVPTGPQLLHEIDLHGPGLQARGVSFAGTEVFVELGHGIDYAWSATSAGSDIIDQHLEKLCNTDNTPATASSTATVFNGVCQPMYER